MTAAAGGEWRFRALVAAGVLPALLVGLVASAAADRFSLAAWGVLAAVAHVIAVWLAWSRRARPLVVIAVDLVLVALLAVVVLAHAAEVGPGLRALAGADAEAGSTPWR